MSIAYFSESALSWFKYLLTAVADAVDTRSFRSAPTNPGVRFASRDKSMSWAMLMPLVNARSICSRTGSPGTLMLISLSKRPPRLNAGSRLSGLFVAARTTTGFPSVFSSARSSMHINSCATMRFSISRWADSRLGVIESISSMKIKQGAQRMASSKCSRRAFSLSPDMPETILGAEMLMKLTPSSAARA